MGSKKVTVFVTRIKKSKIFFTELIVVKGVKSSNGIC